MVEYVGCVEFRRPSCSVLTSLIITVGNNYREYTNNKKCFGIYPIEYIAVSRQTHIVCNPKR